MAQQLLVLKSSSAGDTSISDLFVSEIVAQRMAQDADTVITVHDLDGNPLPHLNSMTDDGGRAEASTDAGRAACDISDRLIAELRAADTLVISSPIHDFSFPSTLRSWFELVLRPRATFTYTEAGPKGLMTGKRAILILAREGVHSEGPAKPLNFQSAYLRRLLAFIGINDVDVIHAEGNARDSKARAVAAAAAHTLIAGFPRQREAA